MKLDDISLPVKLWTSIIALLLAMWGINAWIQHECAIAAEQAALQVQRGQDLVTLATHWKALSANNSDRVLAATVSNEPAVQALFSARLKAGIAASSELQDRLQKLVSTPQDRQALDTITARRAVVLELVKKAKALQQAGDPASVQAFIAQEFLPAIATYEQAQGALVALQEAQRAAMVQQARAAQTRTLQWGIAGAVLVFGLSLAWVVVLLRSINQPIQRVVTLAEAIAQGDLSQTIQESRRDELGRLLRAMASMSERLRVLVSGVHQGISSVSVASAQIASGNQDLSARTEQTASNLQETASSLEQLTGTVAQSAEVAQQAHQLAGQAAQSASRGGEVVAKVVGSMDLISGSAEQMAEIISVIDGIAFQTNILALNAAVEAARAGESGRGFAVVASEVRSLAQRSAEAAKQITALIHHSTQAVQSGAGQVAQAQQMIQAIIGDVQGVSTLIGELATAAAEQRDGIRQINQAVDHIDQMTQQNAALVEESSAAAASLREQANQLTQQVAVFRFEAAAP